MTTTHIIQRTVSGNRGRRLIVAGAGPELPDLQKERLSQYFEHIDFFRNPNDITPEVWREADAVFGFGYRIQSFDQVPRLRLVQLASAGADTLLQSPIWKEDGRAHQVQMATAAGVHVAAIPQWFIMSTLALLHKFQSQILISYNEKRWGKDQEIGGGQQFVQELRDKTVGVLGYGHIGRECARLSVAFGAKVIAATSDGKKKPQDGYIQKGTGDPDGSLPEAWYSTRDQNSFSDFLSRSEVLILALPATPATRHILRRETISHLPKGALVLNVGRGDAIDSDALLAALDSAKLGGAALDVADGEPLFDGHPLFGRKDVIITPHLSGRTVRYFDRAFEIFEENVRRWLAGKDVYNKVDYQRGY